MIKVIKLRKIVIFVILFFIIFCILYYKNGNNIIKNRSSNKMEQILESMENYCADINVVVTSNKTENTYEMYQEVNGQYSMQEVKTGNNIEGLIIELNGNTLKISNTKLNLEKVYENYSNLLNNAMFLNSFASDYKNEENSASYEENDEEIVLKVKLTNNSNTYIQSKTLYVDSKTLNPTKLEVKDNTQNETICIVYNNIELK